MATKTPMTKEASRRITSSTAKKGGDTTKGSFSPKAQSIADKNANKGK